MVSEVLCIVDNLVENLFFLRLEGQCCHFLGESQQLLQLRPRRISGNLHPPVADRTSILVILFDLAAGNLEAFVVIPSFVRSVYDILMTTYHSWHISHSIIIPASTLLQIQKTCRDRLSSHLLDPCSGLTSLETGSPGIRGVSFSTSKQSMLRSSTYS